MEKLEDLVFRAQMGDEAAYDAIISRFQDMALSYAYSILGDYDLAEDARQEAFLSAYCDLLALQNPSAFPGWFRTIVRTHSVKLRKGRRGLVIPLDSMPPIPSESPGPAAVLIEKETYENVREAIGELPESEREVTELFYFDDLAIGEIARLKAIPEQTVKSRLHAGRARLRQRLMEMVKLSIRQKHLAGDKRPSQAATAEAIDQFADELDALLHVPSEEEQVRAGEMLFAKGRLERFMGKMDEALASFRSGMAIPALKSDLLYRASLRTEIGRTHVQMGEYAQARHEFQSARAVVRRLRDCSALLPAILNGLGLCCWGEGNFPKARRYYEESAEASVEAGCEELEIEARHNLALLDWKDGNLEGALEHFSPCLRRWKKMRNPFMQATTKMNMGIAHENLGHLKQAKRHYDEALALAEKLGFLQVQAACRTNLGNLALVQDEWALALEHNERAIELANEIGDKRSQAIALENVALAHIGLGDGAEARRALAKARRTAHALGDQERLFSLTLVEAEAALSEGKAQAALEKIALAYEQLRARGYQSELPRLLRLRAHAEFLAGSPRRARSSLKTALEECRVQKNRVEEQRILALSRQLGLPQFARASGGQS